MNALQIVSEKINTLPPDKVAEVIDFIDFLAQKEKSRHDTERFNLISQYAQENAGDDLSGDEEFVSEQDDFDEAEREAQKLLKKLTTSAPTKTTKESSGTMVTVQVINKTNNYSNLPSISFVLLKNIYCYLTVSFVSLVYSRDRGLKFCISQRFVSITSRDFNRLLA